MKETIIEIRKTEMYMFSSSSLTPTPHMHKEIEIVFVKKGRALCYADNIPYEIAENDISISFPHQIHYYLNSEIGEYYVMIFSADLLHGISSIFFCNQPSENVIHNNKPCCRLVKKIFAEKGNYKSTVWAGLLNLLLPILLSQIELKPKIRTVSPLLQNVLDYCSENFADGIYLDDIASAIHANKYHISYLFNKRLNMPFNQYINTLRINKACHLMKECEKSLTYISEESGFGSIRSFNRAFKQIMNTTPLLYYKQINPQKNTP